MELMIQAPLWHGGVLTPYLLLAAVVVLSFLFEVLRGPQQRYAIRLWAPVLTLLTVGWVTLAPMSAPAMAMHEMLVDDGLFRVIAFPILVALLLSLIAIPEEIVDTGFVSEYVALLGSAGLGMLLLVGANNLMIQFLGLELFSLALYLLCIFLPERQRCQESSLKYFILSSLASAILVYGMALIYGATGTTWLSELTRAGAEGADLMLFGSALIAAALAFKISAAPLHVWTPDVYQGAPTSVTGFMSVATKAAAMGALLRVFPLTFGLPGPQEAGFRMLWVVFFLALAVLSMLVGNLVALVQTDVKRLLAYSSIAQAGYLLVGPVACSPAALKATCFYLMAYVFANLGAFTVVSTLERGGQAVTLDSMRGLSSRRPTAAAVMALALVSLAGLPPTGGFLGKFFLFGCAIKESHTLMLAVVGIATSFLAASYYLGLALRLYAPPLPPANPEEAMDPAPLSVGTQAVLWICLVGILVTGLASQPILTWINSIWPG